jgi:hypothetical protein
VLKKTVTYEDPFNPGVEVTEDLYFNLTKAEIIEMEMGVDGGLKEHLEGVARAQNGQQIMDEMKSIILKAYGKRTLTGGFVKNDMLREEFASSEAYSTLFVEMVTDADNAIEFVSGIMPKGLEELGNANQEELSLEDRFAEKLGTKGPVYARPNLAPVPEPELLTQEQLVSMSREELTAGLASGRYKLA